jgi:hypothetical protein
MYKLGHHLIPRLKESTFLFFVYPSTKNLIQNGGDISMQNNGYLSLERSLHTVSFTLNQTLTLLPPVEWKGSHVQILNTNSAAMQKSDFLQSELSSHTSTPTHLVTSSTCINIYSTKGDYWILLLVMCGSGPTCEFMLVWGVIFLSFHWKKSYLKYLV